MRKVLPAMTVVFALLVPSGTDAGEIAVYTDPNGVINLTDRPVPVGARVQHVIRYKEKSAADLEQQQVLHEQTQHAAEKQKKTLIIRELKEKAVQAKAKAERAGALAREKIEAAEKYLERYRKERRNKRRRNRKTARRVAREATEAQARANAAIDRANQALEVLQEASIGEPGKDR